MKIDISWIKAASNALEELAIVQEGKYPKAFKGYISSLSASIIQSGLIPALVFYERVDSNAENSHVLLVRAIQLILINKGTLTVKTECLTDSVCNDPDRYLSDINKALIALKLAIRLCQEDTDRKLTVPKLKEVELSGNPDEYDKDRYEQTSNNRANVGWLFYRKYYSEFSKHDFLVALPEKNEFNKKPSEVKNPKTASDQSLLFKKYNGVILGTSLTNRYIADNNRILRSLRLSSNFVSFECKTLYPGLLIGSGLSHGTGITNDVKMGFQFDYSTGLPIIPGSSVKGVLRSMFPDREKSASYNKNRFEYIRSILREKCSLEQIVTEDQLFVLTQQIFGEKRGKKNKDITHDIFMDALLTASENEGALFLGDDFITPHKNNPFKDPIPLQFIKVLPNVTFTFGFFLNPVELKCSSNMYHKIDKSLLFRQILKDVGVGAKTNVGYGRLEIKE